MRILFKLSTFLAVFAGLVLFQNCSKMDFKESSSTFGKAGNGTPYEGKVYSNFDATCPEGPALRAQIRYNNPLSATLLHENCQALASPRELTQSEFAIDPANVDILVFENRTFVAEQKQNTSIEFIQRAETYTTDGLPNIVLAGFSQTPQSGNLIICSYNYNTSVTDEQIMSVVDSSGNVFQRGDAFLNTNAGSWNQDVWFAENAQFAPGAYSVSAQTNAPPAPGFGRGVSCLEYSGLATLERSLKDSGLNAGPGTAAFPIQTVSQSALIFVTLRSNGGSLPTPGYLGRSNPGSNENQTDKFVFAPSSSPIMTSVVGDWGAIALIFRGR